MKSPIQNISDYLKIAKESVYDSCGFELSNLEVHAENNDYDACSFSLNGKRIQYRVSKITPKKTGQFVAIWKRDKNGLTAPYAISDNIDFIIVSAKDGENFGQFIFPKSILVDKGIISQNNKDGKRGIRVYPPWDIATNKQAQQTQSWQIDYFLSITPQITPLKLMEMLKN